MTSRIVLLVAAALAALQADAALNNDRFKEVLGWKVLDYQYPTPEAKAAAIKSGEFVAENSNPLGLEVWKDKVFVTVPRWKSGVPSTLNYVKYSEGDKSPVLMPYPSLEANTLIKDSEKKALKEGELPHKIVSVFRVRVDACDRLWVMDSGISDLKGDTQVLGPAKLLVYDLKTDKLLRQYAFKPEDLKEDSFFANVVVDTTAQTCDDAYAYVPDLGGYGLVVYSWKDNSSWRIKHNFFYFDPLSGNYNVDGINFQWTDGVFALALSPVQKEDGYRTVYFHPLSSTHEFKVSSRVLQNKTIAELPETYYAFKDLGTRGPNTQSSASYLDESTGVLFYTQVNRNGLGCWNTKAQEYNPDNNALVAADNVTMIFPNDLKIDPQGNLWMLSNRMPRFHYKHLDYTDVNFRIFKAPAKDLIKGTVCETVKA
ncbi:Protein yellow [Frankliniella fusca]|uniref:Protein yellow n=1 Tax=Frankliniella fusca TaxID=407009 RepID=A0AAE1HCT9_9NEOP|nr:Protein yellow [Frankliniella fusca]